MVLCVFPSFSIKMDMIKSITNLRLKFAATWFAKHVGMLCKIFIGTRANMHQWLVFTGSLDSQNPQAFKDKQPCIPWSSSFWFHQVARFKQLFDTRSPTLTEAMCRQLYICIHDHTWYMLVTIAVGRSKTSPLPSPVKSPGSSLRPWLIPFPMNHQSEVNRRGAAQLLRPCGNWWNS